MTIGAWPAERSSAAVRSITAASVQGAGTTLGGGDQIGRIDRVDHEAAGAAGEPFGEFRGQDRRGRTRQNRGGRRRGVEPGEYRAFDGEVLGGVFLNVLGAVERGFQRRGDMEAGAHLGRRRAVQQIVPFEIRQQVCDIGDRGGGRRRHWRPIARFRVRLARS